MSAFIDLSHLLNEDISIYPGTAKPSFEKLFSVEKDGFAEHKISILTHTGTHLDAPSHLISGGKSVDLFPLEKFNGKAFCIDCTEIRKPEIELAFLIKYKGLIEQKEFVFFRTGWSEKWKKESYYSNFPVLSADACKWLSEFELKGVGIDAISVDPVGSTSLPNHHILLNKEILIIENLTNLKRVENKEFVFSCFPLNIEGADGVPIRAIAVV